MLRETAVTGGLKMNEAIDERGRRERHAETLNLPITFVIRHEDGFEHGEGWVVYERILDGSGQIERV